MNKTSVILFVVALGCLSSSGQTNPIAPRQWFSLPAPQLRRLLPQETVGTKSSDDFSALPANSLSSEPPARLTIQGTARFSQDDRLPDQMALAWYPGEFDFRAYRMIEEKGYLKRPTLESDSAFVRVVNGIFEPTTFRIGKATVACSVVTAIKKKNPLCLINPLVLSISW